MIIALIVVAAIIVIVAVGVPLCGGSDIHFHKKAKNDEIKVACIGDSITNGALLFGCFFKCYPSVLQRKLGKKYHVENFGLNGRTLQSTGDLPLVKEKDYQRSLDFKGNEIIVLLGSNDTKPVNWVSRDAFKTEYEKFLKVFLDQDNRHEIVLCTPPWSLNTTDRIKHFTNDVDAGMLPEICEAIKEAGDEFNLKVIDLYSLFENRLDLLNYDHCHPNRKGARLIAEKVYETIKA